MKILGKGDIFHQHLLVSEKLIIPLHEVSKYWQYVLLYRHKARVCQIDRRTDSEADNITIPKTSLE